MMGSWGAVDALLHTHRDLLSGPLVHGAAAEPEAQQTKAGSIPRTARVLHGQSFSALRMVYGSFNRGVVLDDIGISAKTTDMGVLHK